MKVNVKEALKKRAENATLKHAKASSAAIVAMLSMAESMFKDDPDTVRILINSARKTFEATAEEYNQFPVIAEIYRNAADIVEEMGRAFAKMETTQVANVVRHDANKFRILEEELKLQYMKAYFQGSDIN